MPGDVSGESAPDLFGDVFGDRHRPVLIDGGLSTALEQAGHDLSGDLWTARLLAEDPDAITAAHEAYLRAGAEVIITASYQASVAGFTSGSGSGSGSRSGSPAMSVSDARRLIMSSTTLARRAIARVDTPGGGAGGRAGGGPGGAVRRFVAASVGPFGATLHDGSEYHGRYDVEWSHVRAFHRERLALLVDSGPDLLAIETIPSIAEAEIILEEAARLSDLPMWLSFSCANATTTCHGELVSDIAESVDPVRRVADAPNLIALGTNCTAPEYVPELVAELARGVRDRRGDGVLDDPVTPVTSRAPRVLAYPNHGGRWDGVQWHGTVELDIETQVPQWLTAGATLIGGCCGVGPADIARMRQVLDAQ